MPKILILKGLPASGKSTRAKEQCNKYGWKRINKDDLRSMIDNGKWSKTNEKSILEVRNNLIELYIKTGFNVIVDDTNLHIKHEQKLKELAKKLSCEFEIKEFDIPLHECIERDKNRKESVGANVIIDMRQNMMGIQKQELDHNKKDCYIFDIDGTLAKMNGRSPYDYTRVIEDLPNDNVVRILKSLQKHDIIICTGRSNEALEDTKKRLEMYSIAYTKLYIRQDGDIRKDFIVKKEFHDQIVKKYNILGVFDDRDQVVAMRRGLGLTCFQVGYGNF